MSNKQNILMYTGVGCILLGIVFTLCIQGILPEIFWPEFINFLLAAGFIAAFLRTKKMLPILLATFFLANGGMILAARLLPYSNWGARLVFIPGVILLAAYIFKKHSVILTLGSLFTFWGIFLLVRQPIGISGFNFTVGAFMLFTVLAFLLIWIIERQNWPVLPILIFGVMGSYLIADVLGVEVRKLILQAGCIVLIIVGVVFVIKSMFKNHLDQE